MIIIWWRGSGGWGKKEIAGGMRKGAIVCSQLAIRSYINKFGEKELVVQVNASLF